jgi:uncharacterized protein with von Willebrand factor type A (vWA) domain
MTGWVWMSVSPQDYVDPVAAIGRFADYLRGHGFLIGLAELKGMLQAALALAPEHHRQLKQGWRGIASSSAQQWRQFPELFDAYWFPSKVRGSTRSTNVPRKSRNLQQVVAQMHADMDAAAKGGQPPVGLDVTMASGDGHASEKAMGGASQVDPLHQDFRRWLPDDIATLESCIARLGQRLRRKLIRKWCATHSHQRIDLPATLRQGLSTGGELLKLIMKRRDEMMPRIYVLIDVSTSMEAHASFFLRIGRAFAQLLGARVFVFHTRLAEITPLLKRQSGRVQQKIDAVTFGFGGGTRIASNLQNFLSLYARRQLGARDLVYVLSDGYDTDPPEETVRAIRAIRQRGASLYWLHPNRDVPASEAIQQSRELISGFLAVESLKSLENLVRLCAAR